MMALNLGGSDFGLQSLGGLFEIVEHWFLLLFWKHPTGSGDDGEHLAVSERGYVE